MLLMGYFMEQLSSLSLTLFLPQEPHWLPILLFSFLISFCFYVAVFFLSFLLCLLVSISQGFLFVLFFWLLPLSIFFFFSQWESFSISSQKAVRSTVSSGNRLPISGDSCLLDAKSGSFLYFKASIATAGGRGLWGSKPLQFKGDQGKYTIRSFNLPCGGQNTSCPFTFWGIMWDCRTVGSLEMPVPM